MVVGCAVPAWLEWTKPESLLFFGTAEMNKNYVGYIILLAVVLILGFDAWLYSDTLTDNSISQVIIAWSRGSRTFTAFLGFVFGYLFAHFFDDVERKK